MRFIGENIKIQGKKSATNTKTNQPYLILNLSDPDNGNQTFPIAVTDTNMMMKVMNIPDDSFVNITKSETIINSRKGSFTRTDLLDISVIK